MSDKERLICYDLALALVANDLKEETPGSFLEMASVIEILEKRAWGSDLDILSVIKSAPTVFNIVDNTKVQLLQAKSRNSDLIKLGENVEVFQKGQHAGPTHPTVYKISNSKNSFYLKDIKGFLEPTCQNGLFLASIQNYPKGVIKILFRSENISESWENSQVKFHIRVGLTSKTEVISIVTAVNGVTTLDAGMTNGLDVLRDRQKLISSQEDAANDPQDTNGRESERLTEKPATILTKVSKSSLDASTSKSCIEYVQKGPKRNSIPKDDPIEVEITAANTHAKPPTNENLANVSQSSLYAPTSRQKWCNESKDFQTMENGKKSGSSISDAHLPSFDVVSEAESCRSQATTSSSLTGWKTSTGKEMKMMMKKFETLEWTEMKSGVPSNANEQEVEIVIRGKMRLQPGDQLIAINDFNASVLLLTNQ
eukprot:TRINITY_DN4580_c0_g1_i18.p1 TRINITY_DN4580_c0_g1~~TRINITY_DN4580_c0_g1_i18.p1  ORF type:complete len:448 (-),score=89.65 TRINITY_DN4580_c0_g1_i18:510-1787(-)